MPVIKIPELIKTNEMEFSAALKKAVGCMGIPDMKTKHCKSIETYPVQILSFPCPLDMADLLYLSHSKLHLSFWSSQLHGKFESKFIRSIDIITGA